MNILEAGPNHYPSLQLSIQASCWGFSGASSAWVDLQEVETFLAQLDRCDKERAGKAQLSGMSPDAFQLTLEALDLSGHFGLNYRISTRSAPQHTAQLLSGGFMLDSEYFNEMIGDFGRFFDDIEFL